MILDVEDAIVARLEARIPDVRIYRATELSDINETAQVTPAVHVVYGGYAPTKEVGHGAIQEIETRWMAVVAVRSARRGDTHDKADAIFDSVIAALAGWRPADGKTALKLMAAPPAEHRPGFSYYPIQFATKETVRGDASG